MPGLYSLIQKTYQKAITSGHCLFITCKAYAMQSLHPSLKRIFICYSHDGIVDKVKYNLQCFPNANPNNPFLPPNESLVIQRQIVLTEDYTPKDALTSNTSTVCSNRTECAEYTLLLNRFCIFPRHLLLISKAFVPQSKDLDANDLSAVWNVLEETKDDVDYLVFYNCDKESGCSQGHFHVQFVELSDGIENGVNDTVNVNGIDADGTVNGSEHGREVDNTENGHHDAGLLGNNVAHNWMSSLRVFAQSPSISREHIDAYFEYFNSNGKSPFVAFTAKHNFELLGRKVE